MSFSYATITHQYLNADGTPAKGSIAFTLATELTNGSVTLVAGTRVVANLDASGNLFQRLAATNDPGTVSEGLPQWRVDENLASASTRPFHIAVPSGGVTVDLATLTPYQPS